MPMFFTYRRVGRLSLLPALAAGAVLAAVAGVAAITVGAVVVVAGSVRLLRAIGRLGAAERDLPVPDTDTIEGVVVNSTDSADVQN